jgi:hypothetical protein
MKEGRAINPIKSSIPAFFDISADRFNQPFQAILTQSGGKNFPTPGQPCRRTVRSKKRIFCNSLPFLPFCFYSCLLKSSLSFNDPNFQLLSLRSFIRTILLMLFVLLGFYALSLWIILKHRSRLRL